jgi:hypothetical protein
LGERRNIGNNAVVMTNPQAIPPDKVSKIHYRGNYWAE